jgi:hypothetical protein
MRQIAALRSPGKGDGWLSDRMRETWKKDWWLRYAHRITQDGVKRPEEGRELRTWIRDERDEPWLTRQIEEWVTVAQEHDWRKLLGGLIAEGLVPEGTTEMRIWEQMMNLDETCEEPMSRMREGITRNLLEIGRQQAAGKGMHERFFTKWGWCWDPNDVEIPGISKDAQEKMVKAARESRTAHMRQKVWKIVERNRGENPEWEKWFKSMIGGSWALRQE